MAYDEDKSLLAGCACCDGPRTYDVVFCIDGRGEVAENGECRFSKRSASETKAGSGVVIELLLYEGGGGMEAWLKCGIEADDGDGSGCGVDSNLMGGSDMRDAMEGWEFAGTIGLVEEIFGSRVLLLLSELYITATLVDGEFMVPVRDHPMAAYTISIMRSNV